MSSPDAGTRSSIHSSCSSAGINILVSALWSIENPVTSMPLTLPTPWPHGRRRRLTATWGRRSGGRKVMFPAESGLRPLLSKWLAHYVFCNVVHVLASGNTIALLFTSPSSFKSLPRLPAPTEHGACIYHHRLVHCTCLFPIVRERIHSGAAQVW
jgi:hypothetical protein